MKGQQGLEPEEVDLMIQGKYKLWGSTLMTEIALILNAHKLIFSL